MMKYSRRKVHFIGIGGIGISALVRWYLADKWAVSGSDLSSSQITQDLEKRGARIHIGAHRASWVPPSASLVIYSAAIKPDNPERKRARHLNILERSYAEALNQLAAGYKVIAVSGAHGKSTTTAMAALMLVRAGFDPTVIIGTKLREFKNTNFRKGESRWLLIEADEFHRSFLNYRPLAAITTNIDREHLEYYKSFTNIKKAFTKFFSHVEPSGFLILNAEDKELASVKFKTKVKVLRYRTDTPRADTLKKLLKVPGKHNLSNAMACDTLGGALGIREHMRDRALASFKGTWRRFEFKGTFRGARVYDDYAHHPTEIRATLAGARELFPHRHIWCVFQPHHRERLRLLFNEFISAFADANSVLILETYKVMGREGRVKNLRRDARALAKRLKERGEARYIANYRAAARQLKNGVGRGDIIICMGAGDIWKLSQALCRRG